MWPLKTTTFIILILLIPPPTFGYDDPVLKLSIDYFVHRDVRSICLLNCEDKTWSQKFAKNAFGSSITVSRPIAANRSITVDLGKCFRHKFTPIGILINAKCDDFEDILYFASVNSYFDESHKWLIIENDNNVTKAKNVSHNNTDEYYDYITNDNKTSGIGEEDRMKTVNILDKLNISIDADVTVAKETGFHYDLYEAFSFGKIQGGKIVINKMGMWNHEEEKLAYNTDVDRFVPGCQDLDTYTTNQSSDVNLKGLVANFNAYKYYRRWNFQQLTMKVIVVMSTPPKAFHPEMIIGYHTAPGVATVTQISTILVNEVAEIHNLRFNYTITDRWLSDFSKNSSTDVATSMYFRTQDISPLLRFLPETHARMDFVHPPLSSLETRYFYRIPTYGPGKFENQFLRPLSPEVWGYVTVVMLLCVAALMLSAKLERRPSLIQYAVFSVAASFCQQFFDDNSESQIRKSLVGRKLSVLVTGVSCLLIYNYYTSSVVSWLLNGPPPSLNSLEELLESPLELIFEDVGYARSWIQTPNYYFNKRNAKVEDEMRKKKIFNKKKDYPFLLSLEDGIQMLKAGGYAFHTEVNSANQLISRMFTQSELCELGSLPSMEKTKLFVTLQKNSPYKEFFVWSLARISERGIISCIQRRTGSQPVRCEGSSPRALALGGAAPAFLLLAAGYLLGIGVMVLERFYKKMEDSKVNSKTIQSLQRDFMN